MSKSRPLELSVNPWEALLSSVMHPLPLCDGDVAAFVSSLSLTSGASPLPHPSAAGGAPCCSTQQIVLPSVATRHRWRAAVAAVGLTITTISNTRDDDDDDARCSNLLFCVTIEWPATEGHLFAAAIPVVFDMLTPLLQARYASSNS